jgi:hypothetical protein
MIGSIERLRHIRLALTRGAVPMMLLVVIGPLRPDPISRKGNGYGGVIPIPGPTAGAATTSRPDPILDSRRDARTDRGRVLYAAGHAPRDTATTRAPRKHPCPEQRVVQGRGSTSPNS